MTAALVSNGNVRPMGVTIQARAYRIATLWGDWFNELLIAGNPQMGEVSWPGGIVCVILVLISKT